jgi:hypothetical protein
MQAAEPQVATRSLAPQPKVLAAGAGGALSVILVWLLSVLFKVEVPSEVAAALTTLLAFAGGYARPVHAGRRDPNKKG